MAQGDLDIGLLLKIMKSVGESRDRGDPMFTISTGHLMDLVPAEVGSGEAALNHLDRHVDYLQGEGYLATSPAGIYRWLRLTVKAQKFVQPELAEFGRQPMLPQVVKSLEDQIQVLTYPQEQKDGMLYALREAIAKQAPDGIAKAIAEVGAKILTGGGG
jgi:hypothetical protein